MEYTLRRAERDDIPRIIALSAEELRSIAGADASACYTAQDLERFFTKQDEWVCLAEVGGRVVGFLSIEVHREETDFLYLDDISVTAAYRNRGIGTALLGIAADYARQLRVPAVLLHVRKDNTAARRLYRRLGYAVLRDEGERELMELEIRL